MERTPILDDPPAGRVVLLSVKEMAAALGGISVKQAYRLLDSGVIESRYLGRRRLVSWASLNDYAARLPTERE